MTCDEPTSGGSHAHCRGNRCCRSQFAVCFPNLAFAQPGDTLLYLLLPLHHDAFGVSLAEAGLFP